MKILTILITMVLAVPLYAETYSWVDHKGIYNYSDDPSKVPLKYRNRVIKRGDFDKKDLPAVLPETQTPKAQKEPTGRKEGVTASEDVSGGEKQLYGGKSYDEWQKEFAGQEAELKRIELELAKIRQTVATGRISLEQQTVLLKEHEKLQAEYSQKYGKYGELVESAKRAGLTVEMKKQVI